VREAFLLCLPWTRRPSAFPSHEEIEADPKKLMDLSLALERQVHSGAPGLTSPSPGAPWSLPAARPLTSADLIASTRSHSPVFRTRPMRTYPRRRDDPVQHHHAPRLAAAAVPSVPRHSPGSAHPLAHPRFRPCRGRLAHPPPGWKGHISDVGGPTANMWGAACIANPASCRRASCLSRPSVPTSRRDQSAIADLSARPRVSRRQVRPRRLRRPPRLALPRPRTTSSPSSANSSEASSSSPPSTTATTSSSSCASPPSASSSSSSPSSSAVPASTAKSSSVVPYLISAVSRRHALPTCVASPVGSVQNTGGRARSSVSSRPPAPSPAMFYAAIDPEGNPIPVAAPTPKTLRQHHYPPSPSAPRPLTIALLPASRFTPLPPGVRVRARLARHSPWRRRVRDIVVAIVAAPPVGAPVFHPSPRTGGRGWVRGGCFFFPPLLLQRGSSESRCLHREEGEGEGLYSSFAHSALNRHFGPAFAPSNEHGLRRASFVILAGLPVPSRLVGMFFSLPPPLRT